MSTMLRLPLIILLILSLSSCRKKEHLEVDSESQSIVDNCLADQEFMTIPALVHHALSNVSSAGAADNRTRNCSGFKFTSGDTLDFDPAPSYHFEMVRSGCIINDGKNRSGSLSLRLNSYFTLPGTRCTIAMHGYAANDWKYNCDSIVLISIGSAQNHSAYRMIVYNGTCRRNSDVIRFDCDRTVAVYPDVAAPEEKSKITFFGYSKGMNRLGLAFETEVLEDIVKNNDCRYFTSGSLRIEPKGFKQRHVDFGDGGCEDMASFTVNENTVAFKLK